MGRKIKNIRRRSGGWQAHVMINRIRYAKQFPQETPREEIERWIEEQWLVHGSQHGKGIRRRGRAWQAYVHVNGKQVTMTFPDGTSFEEMRAWIADRKTTRTAPSAAGSFGAEIQTYLSRISAMTSYKQRVAHLELWADALGRDRPIHSITTAEIDRVLQDWLRVPTSPPPGMPGRPSGAQGLGPATVRKRRTALQSFFTKMYGSDPRFMNPVKGAHQPMPPKVEARALDYAMIERIIAAMPDYQDAKPGAIRLRSLARLRVRVIAHTGLPPGILKRIRPGDLDLVAGTLRVVARHKGAGVEPRTLPLSAPALAALRDFHEAQAYGNFATSSVNVSFKRACALVGLDPTTVHLYDLRHSFLTMLYRQTRDLATVARLGLHAEGSPITARYAKGANDEVDRAAIETLNTALAGVIEEYKITPRITPAKTRRHKLRLVNQL